jgi:hypothetical protein
MNEARDNFFAHAALARNQDFRVGARSAFDLVFD